MMKTPLFLAVLVVAVLCPVAAFGWTLFYDGNALPPPGWSPYGSSPSGESLTIDGGNTVLDMWGTDPGGYLEHYVGAGSSFPTLYFASRFRVVDMAASGKATMVIEGSSGSKTCAAIGLGVDPDGYFSVLRIADGGVIKQIAPVDNGYHTAYMMSAPNGAWGLNWDGNLHWGVTAKEWWDMWVEWGAGTYYVHGRSIETYFDWVAYGDTCPVPTTPEPCSLIALAAGLAGLLGMARRRR